jgi:hypothetical protein
MLARREELRLQVKQLETDKANECAPIEAKYQEAMKESYKRRDEDPRRDDQKVWYKYLDERMDLTYAYRDEIKVIEENKYEPKIEGAKSEVKTITKELGLDDCGLCGVEYFRGESKGDRCVDCIDKVDCVHCQKRIHKADLVKCQQCTEQVCVDCLEEGCGQCERRFCYECRDGFTKQRCGASTCEQCSLFHEDYCDCPEFRWNFCRERYSDDYYY